MDNTELHYVTYDPDAIWDEMHAAYLDAGGEALYPGDEKEMLMRAVLAVMVQAFAGVDNALRMQTLRYAVGEYLDLIGENRNCPRISAVAAKAVVAVTTNTTDISETIPAGTVMTADGEMYYSLQDDLALSGVAGTISATIVCERAGSAGNTLPVGTQMYMSSSLAAINSIVVTEAASGGVDEETDDVYRERIREHGLANVTTGPAQQYESVAKATRSEVIDAHAVNNGAGAVKVLLISSAPSDTSVITDVLAALSADDVRPLTDTVTAALAEDVEYVLNVSYTADGDISAAAEAAVSEYQVWQDQKIGRAWNPDRLMAMLYQAGATRVQWGEGSKIGESGPVAYTEITEQQRCSGTITLTT